MESADKSVVYVNDNVLLHEPPFRYYGQSSELHPSQLLGEVKLISPRVAEYYPDITVYELRDGDVNYIYCPNDKPHLWTERDPVPDYDWLVPVSVSCQATAQPGQMRGPLNVYSDVSSYRPGTGFFTGITIKDFVGNGDAGHVPSDKRHQYRYIDAYKLISYNLPSTYSRDYYIFLPYEYDPIAKVIYAFSV